MSRILTLNLDFVLILEGGLLLLLATTSWSRARRDHRQPWRWLAWYALFQSLRTGLNLAVLENNPPPLSDFVENALLAGASLTLLGFAHTCFPRKNGQGIVLTLLGAMIATALVGGNSASLWPGSIIALFSGIWAAAAFWKSFHESSPASAGRPMRLAALSLVACQLITALPNQFLQTEMADSVPDLPLSAMRCALFFILTLTVLAHDIAPERKTETAAHSATRNRHRLLCAAGILLLGLAGWIGSDIAGNNQDKSMRRQIRARTQIAAAAVQADDVAQLFWDERDLTNPAYLRLKALMMSMRRANTDLRFVLLAGIREQKAFFLVDSEKPESADYSPPGQSYDEATADYLAGLSAGRPFVLGPETDRWGTWVFGDAPIVDAQGRTLAYLELDVAAADWDARVRQARLPVLLITLLIIALVLGSFKALEGLRDSSAEISLSEQRNRSLVEGSPDCVQMFDLAGHYVAVNQNGLRALGLTESEVLGRHFSELWPTETRPTINDAIQKTCAGKPTSFEADYVMPDGRTVTWRVATNPVYDTSGRVRSFVGICVDLTVRKQAELALLAAKKAAEESTQAKSDFLAVMSHEIRTPLAGVLGMLDLLQQCPLDAQPRRYTKFARDSADTLMQLLDDALDSAKMEAGKLALESVAFRPHEHFEAAFESAAIRAESKGLSFRHEVAPSVPAVLNGDPTRLRQIISNLLNNALKFTEKGSVSVTLNAVPVGIGTVVLKIAVTDTGIGISEEARTRLFSKYAQAESSTTRHYGGTGLGLSIVKSLAELMGGEINVTSTVGQGSTFTFSAGFRTAQESALPVKATPSGAATKNLVPAKSSPAVRAKPSHQLRVLIVDDDVSNRTVAESLVTFLGHRHVAFAVNGREAVDRLIAEKFDVVLMDNRMPIMDGFTATRLIRDPATGTTDPAVYIIALTANASTDDRAKCLAASMNDFITKPVRSPDMGAALARAIEYLRQRAPASSPAPVTPLAPPVSAPVQLPPGLSEAELLASLDAEEAEAAQTPAADTLSLPPGMIEKITEIFLRETPRRFESMRSAFDRQDTAGVGLEAHTLKSNARYLNANHLSELCAKIEAFADKKQIGEIGPLMQEAEQDFAALREQLLHSLTA